MQTTALKIEGTLQSSRTTRRHSRGPPSPFSLAHRYAVLYASVEILPASMPGLLPLFLLSNNSSGLVRKDHAWSSPSS